MKSKIIVALTLLVATPSLLPAIANDAKEDKILANQQTILTNQGKILGNQGTILTNQKTILSNQTTILTNQKKLDTIIANQEKCLKAKTK